MPFPTLNRTVQRRAITQASANTESVRATVTRTYTDTLGNVNAADVRVDGQVKSLVQVANASGLKLHIGATVEMRSLNGQAPARQITGAAVSSTVLAAAGATGSSPAPVDMASYLAGDAPVLLQSANPADNPNGFVEVPGANVLFTDTAPGTGSGGAAVNGQRLLSVRPLVSTSLPSAQTTTLPDGTLLDLVDSYGNSQGMYRLDTGAGAWRRRDAGGSQATLMPATASTLGGVKIGANITTAADGTISVVTPPVTSIAGRNAAITLTTADIGGLGSAATQPTSAFDAAGAAAAQAASLQKSANLSDLGNAGTARTNLGLGTAATANLPAAGSNASSSQVVRGDDTRLGAVSSTVFISPVSGYQALLQVAAGYQIAPGSAAYVSAPLLTDRTSGDSTTGYKGVAVAAAKPSSPAFQSNSSIASSIIAAWPFYENSGTTVHDIAGNALNLSFGRTRQTWAAGPNGTVLTTNGSGSVNAADSVLLKPASAWTISAYINACTSQSSDNSRFFRKSNGSGVYIPIANATAGAFYTSSTGYTVTGATVSYEGGYHLYTITVGSGTLSYYVDGTLISTLSYSGTPAWDTANLYLMASWNVGELPERRSRS